LTIWPKNVQTFFQDFCGISSAARGARTKQLEIALRDHKTLVNKGNYHVLAFPVEKSSRAEGRMTILISTREKRLGQDEQDFTGFKMCSEKKTPVLILSILLILSKLNCRDGRCRLANAPPEKRKFLRKSQLWPEDFTAKLFCNVEFWMACPPSCPPQ
jgi:hypothetical protein